MQSTGPQFAQSPLILIGPMVLKGNISAVSFWSRHTHSHVLFAGSSSCLWGKDWKIKWGSVIEYKVAVCFLFLSGTGLIVFVVSQLKEKDHSSLLGLLQVLTKTSLIQLFYSLQAAFSFCRMVEKSIEWIEEPFKSIGFFRREFGLT